MSFHRPDIIRPSFTFTRRLQRLVRTGVALITAVSATPAWANGTDPTRISLPNGPASIEGLGRDFVPSLSSGTASFGVDIAVPPAANGFSPKLSLDYDAGGGVSELGLGFRLGGLPSIRRRTENGLPRFDDTDAFELSGVGIPCDLLEMSDGYFRPQYESSFTRVERGSDGKSWEARAKSGVTFRFGGDSFVEQEGSNVATYLLREQVDLHGHTVSYQWDTSEGRALLTSVIWNDFGAALQQKITLKYEARPDVHVLFSSGIRQILSRRLKTIEVTLGGKLVRRYTLSYATGNQSLLQTVDAVGTDGVTATPTLSLSYTAPKLAGDGQVVTMKSPPGRTIGDANVSLADLNGDGLPDLLVTQAGQYRSYVNDDGATWLPAQDWSALDSPSLALSQTGVQLADLDGDGAIDLVAKSGSDDFRFFPGLDATHWGTPVSIATVPSFTFEDPDVRLVDLDGDRRTDVAITTEAGLAVSYNLAGTDWSDPTLIGVIDPKQPLRFSDGKTQLCDVNGDRVEDFCYLTPGSLVYWLGRGRGVFESAAEASGVPKFDASDPWRLVDLNSDGWVDLVHVAGTQVDYALATSAGVFSAAASIKNLPEKTPTTTVDFADMDASGTTDIVWVDVSGSPNAAWRYLELFPQGRAGLLQTIDNGLGKVTSIAYEPAALSASKARAAGKPWTTRMNVPMPVVSELSVDSSLGDPLVKTGFSYSNGTWDPVERTFAGFGGGVQTETGDEFTPTLLSENTFDTGLSVRTLRGSMLTSEQYDAQGYLFSKTTNTYTPVSLDTSKDGRSLQYAYKSAEQVEHIEGTSTDGERVTLIEWAQDNYGNVLEERHWGEVSGENRLIGNDEAITLRTYANDTDDWVLGYLATEELRDAAGNRVAMKRNYYDGDAFQGLPLGKITRGDVMRQEEWVGPAANKFVLETATKINDDGQPVETKDARGGGRFFEWDASDHTTLKSEQVKLETDVNLIESAETDPRFGELLSVTEYNGQKLSFQYDALGRLTGVINPGDSVDAPSVSYTYEPAAPLSRVVIESRVWAGTDQMERTESVFDGFGRKRASFTRDENERWVMAGVGLLDARSQIRRALRPRFVTAADVAAPPLLADALGTSSWRDASARMTRTLTQSGIESKTEYQPLTTLSWDGGQTDSKSPYEHLPTEHDSDGLGRTVSATQYLRSKPLTSAFTFDAAGHLLTRTDPEGNVAQYSYDGRGLRTLVDDPDLGKRTLVYDDTGNLIERDNPDGSVLKYSFDLAGRSLTEDWNGDGTPEVTRHWDIRPDAADNLLFRGKLALTDEPTGSTAHEYDERGRITNTTVTIDGQSYASGSHYDNLGRESLHIYPDGSSIKIARNPRGQLSGYGDGAVQYSFDGDGLQTESRTNTGVVQKFGYDQDRRLTELTATGSDQSLIEHLKWGFDSAGNVQSLQDLRPSVAPADDRSETYGYDNLYRLRSAQGSWGNTAWSYSPSGNLTARTSTIASQNVSTLNYGENAGPHALTTLDARSLAYDSLGRMLTDGDRTYAWNSADQLTDVSSKSGASEQNRFDADGIRRVRVEKNADGSKNTVLFISPWSEVKNGKLVRYIVHTERRIARLSDTNGTTQAEAAPLGQGDAEPPLALRILAQLGQLALTLALLTALIWTQRRRLARAFAIAAPAVCLLVLAGCSSDKGGPNAGSVQEGTVRTLTSNDALFINDQLGSLLAETDGKGAPTARFAAYAYGVTRYESSNETRQYANAPRDRGVGLDLMGARFYAPELGVWTIGDPVLVNAPEKTVSEQFATANPYAYSNLNPIIGRDSDGNFFEILVGAAVGALVGGGIEAAHQYLATGRIESWGRVAGAAAGGAMQGIILTACPAVGIAEALGYGALSGAASGMTERLVASGGKSAGGVKEAVVDAGVGAATAGVVKGASAVVRKLAGSVAPVAARAVANAASAAGDGAAEAGAGRVFWSGGRLAKNAAAQFASRTGGTTLEMTQVGKALESAAEPWVKAEPLWRQASADFAIGAKGTVHVFLGDVPRATSLWSTVERSALQENPAVVGITIHLPVVQ
jgi:RHS repeat-associated protein